VVTHLLYFEDSYLTRFSARIVEKGHIDAKPAVILDRTAFYPEGGGQPADRGVLAGVRVLDVQKRDGKIWHILDKPVEHEPGTEVNGEIDWGRRFDFMQQHHGQHLLSAAFEEVLGARTVSVHMGEEICTLDIDRPFLTEEEATAAEDRANEMVWADVPVHARFVTEEELARLPLRNPPKVSGAIRIVSAGDFDHSPCGGTHPLRTGEVGMIVLRRWERHKECIRVEFVCGRRALNDYRTKNRVLLKSAAKLSVGFPDLPRAIERLQTVTEECSKELKKAREELAVFEAGRLLAAAPRLAGEVPLVIHLFEDRTMEDARRLARIIVERGGIALLGMKDGTAKLLFARTPALSVDMSVLMREAAAIVGGKGGGKPDQAQGGGPHAERLAEALDHARKCVLDTVGQDCRN
jgi:alanyl-tRNA synthetase